MEEMVAEIETLLWFLLPLIEVKVWYFPINDALAKSDSVEMRFILRWVIGAHWE